MRNAEFVGVALFYNGDLYKAMKGGVSDFARSAVSGHRCHGFRWNAAAPRVERRRQKIKGRRRKIASRNQWVQSSWCWPSRTSMPVFASGNIGVMSLRFLARQRKESRCLAENGDLFFCHCRKILIYHKNINILLPKSHLIQYNISKPQITRLLFL